MSLGSAIYLVSWRSEDGLTGRIANLEDVIFTKTENLDDPENAKATLTMKWGAKVVYTGPIVPMIVERFRLLANPDYMAFYWRWIIQETLKGPRKKAGRPSVYRDASGVLQNCEDVTKSRIDLWDQGLSVEEIDSTLNSRSRLKSTKIFDQGEIRRTLRRYKRLLLRPYITKSIKSRQ